MTQGCPHCDGEHEPAFVAADEALVALELGIELFNVKSERHAKRIALSEIGQQLVDIPLEVVAVTVSETEEEIDSAED